VQQRRSPRRGGSEEPIVTTALDRADRAGRADRASQNGQRHFDGAVPAAPRRPPSLRRRLASFLHQPAWPLVLMLAAWPVWWFLGFGDYVPILFAMPMIRRMYHWRVNRQRAIRVPPGFWLWGSFLVIVLAGVTTLGQEAPGTVTSPGSHRLISWALRSAVYVAVTVVLLYAGNLTEEELPRRRLAWLLGLVGIYTAIGGFCGVIAPHTQFTSPFSYVIPQSIQQSNGLLQMMLHPGFSQVQNFLGFAEGRPRAPFDYTNMWGNCLAILVPFLLVAWWAYGNRKERRRTLIVLAIAFVPTVYSLDRGLWVGIGLSIGYLALRFAARGKLALLAGLVATIGLVGVVVVASPLQGLIQQRLSHGKSNAVRDSLSGKAVTDALASPFIGYGDTRHELGSTNSIAVGKTLKCNSCGSRDIGGNGQLWQLLICDGFLGAALYFSFFAYGAWRYRRDLTPYGMAGVLVILVGFVFAIVYIAVGPPLLFTMLAYALLWKNDRELKRQAPAAVAAPAALGGPRIITSAARP
jgi:hypothetical protein